MDGPQSREDYIDILTLLLGKNHAIPVGQHELFAAQEIKKAVAASFEGYAKPHDDGLLRVWDKVQGELNRAGKAAQDALDEGRLRLEIFRVRQLADKAAQALGYAVYRAKEKSEEVEPATWDRLAATLREHEAEASRLDAELQKVKSPPSEATAEPAPAATTAAEGAAAPADTPPSA